VPLKPGDAAPDFTLTDAAGAEVSLAGFRGRKVLKPAALTRFDTKYGLGFPLLSDPDHAVAEAYGAWGEKKNYGRTYMGIIRSAFLVDEEGRIEQAWPKISPADTPTKLKAALGV
jgi:peroxiredoxin Q/BCP